MEWFRLQDNIGLGLNLFGTRFNGSEKFHEVTDQNLSSLELNLT